MTDCDWCGEKMVKADSTVCMLCGYCHECKRETFHDGHADECSV